MWRFWTSHIEPLMRAARPRRVMEIGADDGFNTRRLLAFCRETGAKADIVDPEPTHRLKDAIDAYPDVCVHHRAPSLEVIPSIAAPDIALVDGDHNWRTVYQEFAGLFERARKDGQAPPIVLFHEAAWPYARRDMYYAPKRIEEEFRQPFAYKGMDPEKSELVEEGLNAHFANAVHEGGPRNGVLTAVEDFAAEWPDKIHLHILPFFNGLGVATPDARMTPEVRAVIDGYFTSDALLAACKALEGWNSRVLIALQRERLSVAKRTEALKRAREILKDRAARIAELEAELAKKT